MHHFDTPSFFCIRTPDFIVSLQLVKSNYIVF